MGAETWVLTCEVCAVMQAMLGLWAQTRLAALRQASCPGHTTGDEDVKVLNVSHADA